MKILVLALALMLPAISYANEVEVVRISPKYCVQGEHRQPNGFFSLYVFCDDALGTNVALFAKDMDNPLVGASDTYDLGRRFWQGEEWAYDVVSFAWLNKRELILSTAAIYGTGSVYILDLPNKTARNIFKGTGAVVEIKKVTKDSVRIEMEGPKDTFISKQIPLN